MIASGPASSPCATAEWSVDNLLVRGDWMVNSFSARVLQALAARSPSRSICAAGRDLLCIAGDGDVYPCWMFVGEPSLKLGSFAEPDPRPWDWSQARALFEPGDLGAHPDCQTCFARNLSRAPRRRRTTSAGRALANVSSAPRWWMGDAR